MTNWKNRTMWTGDNLDIMRGMNSESVDLIYLDPPFNSKQRLRCTHRLRSGRRGFQGYLDAERRGRKRGTEKSLNAKTRRFTQVIDAAGHDPFGIGHEIVSYYDGRFDFLEMQANIEIRPGVDLSSLRFYGESLSENTSWMLVIGPGRFSKRHHDGVEQDAKGLSFIRISQQRLIRILYYTNSAELHENGNIRLHIVRMSNTKSPM